MQVYLVRHTTPKIAKGICYGQTDIPVNYNLFPVESAQVISKLPIELDALYCSPLQRCQQLAASISTDYQTDARLMEMNFGTWEMQNWDSIDSEDLKNWSDKFVETRTPQGENFLDLYERNEDFINDLLDKKLEQVAIIAHAGNIRSMLSWVLDLPLKNTFRISVPYGAVINIEIFSDKNYNKLISIK